MRAEDRLAEIIDAMIEVLGDDDGPEDWRNKLLNEIHKAGFFIRPGDAKSPVVYEVNDLAFTPRFLVGFWRGVAAEYPPLMGEGILRCASELEGALLGSLEAQGEV